MTIFGSARTVVDASGSVVQTYDYYPFGLEMPGRSLTSGSTARERFTGHERDEEVGLDYMQARRYAAEFGRFLSVDPLVDDYPGWNPYHYVHNNPLFFIDPDGMMATDPPYEPDHRAVRDAYVHEAFTEIKAVFNLFKVKAIEFFAGDGKKGLSVDSNGNITGSVEDNYGKIEVNSEGEVQGTFKVGDFAEATFDSDGNLNSASVSIPINKVGTRAEGGRDNVGNISLGVAQRIGKFVFGIRAWINPEENRNESNRMVNEARDNTKDVILDGF